MTIEKPSQSADVIIENLESRVRVLTEQVELYRNKYQREQINTNRWKNRAELAEAQIKLAQEQVPTYMWRLEDDGWMECTKEWFDAEISAGYEKRIVYPHPIPAQQTTVVSVPESGYEICSMWRHGSDKFYLQFGDRSGLYVSEKILLTTEAISAIASAVKFYGLPEYPANTEQNPDKNLCALKSITDQQVNAVVRAFWRRIYAYRNDYGIELPKPLPVEFFAHMATALSWVDREPERKFVDLRQIVSDGSK